MDIHEAPDEEVAAKVSLISLSADGHLWAHGPDDAPWALAASPHAFLEQLALRAAISEWCADPFHVATDPAGEAIAAAPGLRRDEVASDDHLVAFEGDSCRVLQRRFADADAVLDDADRLLSDRSGRARVRSLLERGRIRRDLSRTEEALGLFRRALALAEATGEEFLALDALHMIGYASHGEDALRVHRTAIERAERSRDPRCRRWLGTLTLNAAREEERLGRWTEALALFESAARYREEAGRHEDARDALAFAIRVRRRAGRLDEAHGLIEALLAEPGVAREHNGYVLEEAAECRLARGDEKGAREAFRAAYDLLSHDL
jgi:tetratricopeptide (TPR) repeat protein